MDKIKQELILCDEQVDLMMTLHKSMFCLGALSQAYAHNIQKDYKEDCKHWREIIKNNLGRLWNAGSVSMYRKILLTVGCISPKLMSKLDMLRRSHIANKSID